MNNLSDALYPLKKQEKFGYIDKTGRWIVDPIYDFASDFTGDAKLAVVVREGEAGFINREGVIEIGLTFDDAENFENDGLARVQIDEHWGCIDNTGTLVIVAEFDNIGLFSDNGFAMAERDGLKGYIDKTGEWVIKPQFSRAWPFEGKLAKVLFKNGIGVIDEDNQWVIEPKFDHAEIVHELIYLEKYIGAKALVGYASVKGDFLTFNKKELEQIFNGS